MTSVSGQVGDSVGIDKVCSYFGERAPMTATLFSSDREAEDTIRRIVDASGLAQNFDVKAAGVPNAAAVIHGTRRMILYNQFFMTETREKTGSQWAPVSILAHEIGHHLNGHTLDRVGSRPRLELEADFYSGFILQKLGASLPEARVAMDKIGSSSASDTHPAKHDRLAAITNGWRRSCDADPKCGNTTSTSQQPPAPRPANNEPPEVPKAGPNSCEFANDDECDEPNLCEAGTDTNDCRSAAQRRRAQPQQELATQCVTSYGACPLNISTGPKGYVCTCWTMWGPVQGVSR